MVLINPAMGYILMNINKTNALLSEILKNSAKLGKETLAKINRAGLFKGRGFSLREGQIISFSKMEEMKIFWTETKDSAILSTSVTTKVGEATREEEFPAYALRKCVSKDAPDYEEFDKLVQSDPLLYDLTKGEVNDLTNFSVMAGRTFKVHVHMFTNRRKGEDIPEYKVYTFEEVQA